MVLTLQVVFAAKSRTKLKSNTNLKGRVLFTVFWNNHKWNEL